MKSSERRCGNRRKPVTPDHTDDYRFGYSPEELARLGDQHRVWAADNRRFRERAGFDPAP